MPYCEDDEHGQNGQGVERPEAPLVALQILEAVVLVVRNLHGAVDCAQGDDDGREVDGVAEFAPELHVAEVEGAPVARDVEVAHRDYGEGQEAHHLQDEPEDQNHAAGNRFALGGFNGPGWVVVLVVCARDLRGAD